MNEFSHFDEQGQSRMVDIGEKPVTRRFARAAGRVVAAESTIQAIYDHQFSKGDVLEVARLAGIMGGKKTADLIPLCHPLAIDSISIQFEQISPSTIEIQAEVTAHDRTGVEMEALTSVSIAALTIYDMCKSVDRDIKIERIELREKSGGKSGHYQIESSKD